MSARSTATIDPEAVRAIVAEVLRRIGPMVKSDLPATPPTASQASTPSATPAPAVGGVSLPGRVISLALLEKLPAGTGRLRGRRSGRKNCPRCWAMPWWLSRCPSDARVMRQAAQSAGLSAATPSITWAASI